MFAFTNTIISTRLNDIEVATAGEMHEEATKQANILVEDLKAFIPKLIEFGIKVIIALIIFFVGRIIIRTIHRFIKKLFDKSKLDRAVSNFLLSIIKVICYALLLVIMLDMVGIQTTSFVAIIGTASLTIGLSLQGSLANFAGGVLILVLKPFVLNDYVIFENGVEGNVSKIDIFYTTIITPDNKKVVIPNGNLSNSNITNCSAMEERRIDINVGISYGSDIEKAKKVIVEAIKEVDLVLQEKEPFVYVDHLDSSQVTLGIWVYTKSTNYLSCKFRCVEAVKLALDKNGIEIPFDQVVVHMKDK